MYAFLRILCRPCPLLALPIYLPIYLLINQPCPQASDHSQYQAWYIVDLDSSVDLITYFFLDYSIHDVHKYKMTTSCIYYKSTWLQITFWSNPKLVLSLSHFEVHHLPPQSTPSEIRCDEFHMLLFLAIPACTWCMHTLLYQSLTTMNDVYDPSLRGNKEIDSYS